MTRDADPEVIERAYKALSRKHHPDMRPSDAAESNRRMRQINEAYEVLRNPGRRRAYDASLPTEPAHGWDVFWERGLVGLFVERFGKHG